METLFQEAVLLQKSQQFEEAISKYLNILSDQPKHLATRYNLACIYAAQKNWPLAIENFEFILTVELECIPALYNLAICYQGYEQDDKAIETVQKVLSLQSDHVLALQTLGSLFLKKADYDNAKTYLLAALEKSPEPDIYFHLGLASLGEDNKTAALYFFDELVKKYPHYIDAHYNMAVIYQQQGNYAAALRAYAEVLKQHPSHFSSLYNSGIIFQYQGLYDRALEFYERAKLADPQYPNVSFLIQALKEQNPNDAPSQYVESLFDSYADHYDQHIEQQLKYDVPKQLYDLFCSEMKKQWKLDEEKTLPYQAFTMIDLGCGTGLAGCYFKPLAHTLIGVDLSSAMLRQASKKQCYTTLNQQDNIEYLKKINQETDIIVAADVLGYYGNLEDLFATSKNALKEGGCWLFSIEHTADQDFHLQKNARFSHSTRYIKRLADQYHFKTLTEQQTILRYQQGEPVIGFLYLLVSLPF